MPMVLYKLKTVPGSDSSSDQLTPMVFYGLKSRVYHTLLSKPTDTYLIVISVAYLKLKFFCVCTISIIRAIPLRMVHLMENIKFLSLISSPTISDEMLNRIQELCTTSKYLVVGRRNASGATSSISFFDTEERALNHCSQENEECSFIMVKTSSIDFTR